MKIFITGCAKSGTTLLLRLFGAFSDVTLTLGEINLSTIARLDNRDKILVAKRDRRSIYSSEWHGEKWFLEHIHYIQYYQIILVNIFRDGRDVIESNDALIAPKRWIASIYQMLEYPQYLTCNLRYEDIVTKPDEVQQDVANSLGLHIEYKWSDYPNFLDNEVFKWPQYSKKEHRARPLSTNRILKSPDLYRSRCLPKQLKNFEYCLRRCDYEIFKEKEKTNE